MSLILQVFCTIFSSILIALAIPNEFLLFGSPVLGIFSLIPLYIAIFYSKSYGRTFSLFFLHGAVAHCLSSFWLSNFEDFAIFTLGASALGTAIEEGLCGILIYFPFKYRTPSAKLSERSGRDNVSMIIRCLWFPAMYSFWEFYKALGFLAYPWGVLSMTAYNWPLITQIAAITGPTGVTFLFALFSALVSEGIILFKEASGHKSIPAFQNWITAFRFTAVLFLVTVFYGAVQFIFPYKPIKTMNTVIVQQNQDPWTSGDLEAITASNQLSEREIINFAENGHFTDLVVWSEGVLSHRFPDALEHYSYFPPEESLIDFIKRMRVPFVIGAPTIHNPVTRQSGNSTILIGGDGSYQGSYTKMHLVPFAELIPGVEYEIVRKIMTKLTGGISRGWAKGDKYVLYEIPVGTEKQSVKIATPICYDDAFSDVCRGHYLAGSEVLVNLTNDSWSLTKSAEFQHFVVAQYRAIECRTTLVRSTEGGFSCVVDPTGRILNQLEVFKTDAMGCQVPVYEHTMTTYALFGDWLPLTVFIAATITAFILRRKENLFWKNIK